MPELPEVETTRRGIAPHVQGQRIIRVVVREPRLRWPVPDTLAQRMGGRVIEQVERRAKYLLLHVAPGTAILHLGMSGSLRIVDAASTPDKHDHVDLVLASGKCLRLRDPRRFGALLWTEDDAYLHPLLRSLGPEPLGENFCGAHLHDLSRGRRLAVKPFLMDGKVVVGVGNIYASEALFRAGIHPTRQAGRVSARRYDRLAEAIREVLDASLRAGGTTLRDFLHSDGTPGYFEQKLAVYGRAGQPCASCGVSIRQRVLGQRATYYCPRCQR